MDVSSAVMVLLMCSGSGTDCMQIRSERTYETAALCREALPSVVRRLNQAGKKVSGRCASVVDQPAEFDPVETGSIHRAPEVGTATVRVTRIQPDGRELVDEYVVPKE